MYFQSVTGNQAYCDAHVLSFQPLLKDLSKATTTPNFSWLSPNLCRTATTRRAPTATRRAHSRSTGSCTSGSRRSWHSPAYRGERPHHDHL